MTTVTEMYPIGRPAAETGRTSRRPSRVVAFGISGDDWDTLIEMGVSEARDPFQQARWVVLQAIRGYAEQRAS